MFLHLVLRRVGDSIIRLTLSFWFRVVFLMIIGVFLTGMGAAGYAIEDLGIIPILFILLCCLSILYQETWVFDRGNGTVTHQFGLFVLARKTVIPISEITGFHLTTFIKGSQRTGGEKKTFFQREIVKLWFSTETGMRDIEIQGGKAQKRLEEIGKALASFCSKPFSVQDSREAE